MSTLRSAYERITNTDTPMDYRIATAISRGNRSKSGLLIGNAYDRDISDGYVTLWDSNTDLVRLESAQEIFLSSSNAADVGVLVAATLYTADYDMINAVVALNGQNQVSTGMTGILVQDLTVLGMTEPQGDIYAAPSTPLTGGVPTDTTKIQSKIIQGKNVTHNGYIMIPKGFIGMSVENRASTNSVNKIATIGNVITQPGSVPITPVEYSVSLSPLSYQFPIPVAANQFNNEPFAPFVEGTFIEIKCSVNSTGTNIFIGGDFLFVREELFNFSGPA